MFFFKKTKKYTKYINKLRIFTKNSLSNIYVNLYELHL